MLCQLQCRLRLHKGLWSRLLLCLVVYFVLDVFSVIIVVNMTVCNRFCYKHYLYHHQISINYHDNHHHQLLLLLVLLFVRNSRNHYGVFFFSFFCLSLLTLLLLLLYTAVLVYTSTAFCSQSIICTTFTKHLP